jgi:hypothetical protein
MRIRFVKSYMGISPGTVTEETNPRALEFLTERRVIDAKAGTFECFAEQVPDDTPTTAEIEKAQAARAKAADTGPAAVEEPTENPAKPGRSARTSGRGNSLQTE